MDEDREQPFAAFVLETLTRQSTKVGQRWAERAQLAATDSGEPNNDTDASGTRDGVEQLVQVLLAVAADDECHHESLMQAGVAMGLEAHRRNASLQLMLKEVDLLEAVVLQAAEGIAPDYPPNVAGHEGLAVAIRIASATSQLRLAAAMGYTQAIEDELRERYRTIRHDLRNPLATIKTAVALLTDEHTPPEMRESLRVRTMVGRNTRSLDQIIDEALGDAAARLRAFDTFGELPPDARPDLPTESATSRREQPDDVTRTRQRSDLKSGAF